MHYLVERVFWVPDKAKSFFSMLKNELSYQRNFATREEALWKCSTSLKSLTIGNIPIPAWGMSARLSLKRLLGMPPNRVSDFRAPVLRELAELFGKYFVIHSVENLIGKCGEFCGVD